MLFRVSQLILVMSVRNYSWEWRHVFFRQWYELHMIKFWLGSGKITKLINVLWSEQNISNSAQTVPEIHLEKLFALVTITLKFVPGVNNVSHMKFWRNWTWN